MKLRMPSSGRCCKRAARLWMKMLLLIKNRELRAAIGCGTTPSSGSALAVFVVAAPPRACPCLVASLGGAVEPLVHTPEAVQPTRIGGIVVVDDAVLAHERAHARPIAPVCGHVG